MNGVINFLKPPGMTSNGAVVFLRGLLGLKTGHAGTLDPGACGVLPICVGKATKISSYLMANKKEYIAELTLGTATDTGDSYGKVTAVSDVIPDDIKPVLGEFTGSAVQQTPMYSAAKHEGQKLYQLARAGIEVETKLRNIEIYELEHLSKTGDDSHLLRIVCGKGTYIRTLCEDIAKRLGTVGYMSFLARTKCAGLDINDSITADELKEYGGDYSSVLLPMDGFLSSLEKITVCEENRNVLYNGGHAVYNGKDISEAVVFAGKELVGIGKAENKRVSITTRLVD